MAESTGIGWCDATFNPWIGCSKVSPGCAHCYAETLVRDRMGRPGTWGDDGTRQRTSEGNWRKPLRWNRLAGEGRLPDGSENPDGRRPRIFCASLADVFEPRPELDPWRLDLLDLIDRTRELDWLLLTKRPEVARDQLDPREIPPNVWLGVSIENSRHTWRADVLREIPAAVRFISAEPLLGSLFEDRAQSARHPAGSLQAAGALEGGADPVGRHRAPLDLSGIDWVIVGGESGGRSSRPMHPDWAREIREAVVWGDTNPAGGGSPESWLRREPPSPRPALYFKQWGSWAPVEEARPGDRFVAGSTPPFGQFMRYVGASPTAGGKLLDGSPWCEFPQREMMPA